MSAFFPRKHQVDRLPYAQITEYFKQETQANKNATKCHRVDLFQDLLFEIIELSQEFSDLGQSNFHLLLNHIYKNVGRFLPKVQVKLAFISITVFTSEKPAGIYARCASLLPDYYTFLFRLTPF
ncbi:hypothetical protein [Adhaeribacter radiodurans]|uniref:Uncharacterized protein n=1 Tax=Adhaeribacter radiodurans TaxID=2745197 RepID=A0A7L7LA18_9BACT|nr:hypothetical protein [Adhaeribacter radiodurans]QMU29681.1 hypothetical protein HUW48_17325 [Adhaeribacter radiodurans]